MYRHRNFETTMKAIYFVQSEHYKVNNRLQIQKRSSAEVRMAVNW